MNSIDSLDVANSRTLTYRSDRTLLLGIVLFGALGLIISSLAMAVRLQFEGLPLLPAILLAVGITIAVSFFNLLNQSATVTITDTVVTIRHGIGVFTSKEEIIPLKMIHTLQIVGTDTAASGGLVRNRYSGTITLAYRSPAKKMLYATAWFSVNSMPNGSELILELAKRTKATIKLQMTTKLGPSTITYAELEELLPRLFPRLTNTSTSTSQGLEAVPPQIPDQSEEN